MEWECTWSPIQHGTAGSPTTASTWIIRVSGERSRHTEGGTGRVQCCASCYVHVGMDVSKDTIAVAVLPPDRDVAEVEKVFNDEESVRRLIKRLGPPEWAVGLLRRGADGLRAAPPAHLDEVRCDVVAPSLVPKGSGDRVKTDRRDSRRLAGLHRAGELTAIAVPTPAQEAVRDLCRTRGDMVGDLTRGPQPAQRVPPAPLRRVAGRLDVDPAPRALARGPAL